MTKHIKLKIIASFCITLMAISGHTYSQQPLGFNVTRVQVRPGADVQFEAFIAKFKEGAERINWSNGWTASQVAIGNTLQYVFVTPFSSYADLSTPVTAILGQAYELDEITEILKGLTASASSISTGTYHPRADLSNPYPEPVQNPEAILTVQVSVHPGTQIEFEDWVHKVVEGSDEIYWNGLVKAFGEGPDYVFRSPGTWASFDQPATSPQQRVLTEFGSREGSRIIEQANAAMSSSAYSMSVDRPDMSYSP